MFSEMPFVLQGFGFGVISGLVIRLMLTLTSRRGV